MAEYIEREAALEICEKEYQERLRMLDYCGDTVAWNIGNAIKAVPAAVVAEVRHGRWEFPIFADSDNELDPRVKCSECGEIEMAFARWKYCPNCGAKMEGGIPWRD